MDRFKDMKLVNSPISSSNSPGYTYESHRSIIINRTEKEIEPTKLDFKGNVDSKFPSANLIQSQVFSNNGRNSMNESTINYMRSIYRGIPGLSEDRLRQITNNFIKLYGTNN